MPSPHRFPPPWTIEEHNNACFVVKDATGEVLGYSYFEDEPGQRSAAQAAHQERGPPHGGELRQAADAAALRPDQRQLPHSGPAAFCPVGGGTQAASTMTY